MMELLRKNMKKILWVIAALFIGGIFFWHGWGPGAGNVVARVGKIKIEVQEFERNLSREIQRRRDQQEEELSEDQIRDIRRDVLSSLISNALRYQEAKKIGISSTDEEIIATIQSLPQFQQDERFNFQLYEQTLRFSMNITPEEFEELIKEDIIIRKLEMLILSSAKVTLPEMKLHYLNENNSLDGFEENKEELRSEILQNKRMALYNNWMITLQQNYDITVNPELIELIN